MLATHQIHSIRLNELHLDWLASSFQTDLLDRVQGLNELSVPAKMGRNFYEEVFSFKFLKFPKYLGTHHTVCPPTQIIISRWLQ